MQAMISILLCTRNRAESLKETLSSLARCRTPEGLPTELLIIDNGSTDRTKDVVLAAQLSNMTLRYIFEPRPAKSVALNTGIAHSHGHFLVTTDDDVQPELDWLPVLLDPIRSGRGDASSGVLVLGKSQAKSWMTPYFRPWFETHPTESLEECDSPGMIGANMAFSRRVLEKVAGFDPHLGPGALGFGDDSLFATRLKAEGFRIRFVPKAVARHYPDPKRFTRDDLLRAIDCRERSGAFIDHHWDQRKIRFARMRMVKCRFQLAVVRATTLFVSACSEGLSESEAKYLSWHLRFKYYLAERKKPPQYRRN